MKNIIGFVLIVIGTVGLMLMAAQGYADINNMPTQHYVVHHVK